MIIARAHGTWSAPLPFGRMPNDTTQRSGFGDRCGVCSKGEPIAVCDRVVSQAVYCNRLLCADCARIIVRGKGVQDMHVCPSHHVYAGKRGAA